MDDVFYRDLAEGAAELIAELGQPCTLAREGTGGGVYDPETSTTTDASPDASYPGNAVKLDYETKDIDGTDIRSGDVRFLIGFDLQAEPKSDETITLTRDASKWRVVKCKPLDPGGFVVLYDVQARAT